MELNLVVESIKFMIIGMTVVYAFLILLVYAMTIQSKVVTRFFPEKKQPVQKPAISQEAATEVDDSSTIAAIVGAIKAYKNKHN